MLLLFVAPELLRLLELAELLLLFELPVLTVLLFWLEELGVLTAFCVACGLETELVDRCVVPVWVFCLVDELFTARFWLLVAAFCETSVFLPAGDVVTFLFVVPVAGLREAFVPWLAAGVLPVRAGAVDVLRETSVLFAAGAFVLFLLVTPVVVLRVSPVL